MTARGGWIAFAVAVVVAALVFVSMPRVQSRCEVCLQFGDELVCRRGAGATEAEAREAAQQSACGGNTSGMSDAIMCANREPERLQCTTD